MDFLRTINKRRGRSRNAVRISLKLEAAAAEQMSNGNGLASVAPLAPLSTPSLRLGGRLVTHAGTFVVKLLGACRQGSPSRKKADDPQHRDLRQSSFRAPSDTGV